MLASKSLFSSHHGLLTVPQTHPIQSPLYALAPSMPSAVMPRLPTVLVFPPVVLADRLDVAFMTS